DRIAGSPEGYSAEFWQRYAELGAIAALFDEADGGLGGTGFDIAVVFEALGRGLVVEPFLDALMAGDAIAAAGTAAQKQVLEDLLAGSVIVSLAHAEPQAGYELAHVETRARPEGDGWVLDGAKAVVAQAEHAGLFVVSARTGGNAADADGISLFLVQAGTPGLQVQGYPLIDGGRAGELALAGVRVGADALL